jgi:lipopolysaccharide transport system ATP-binding protein
MTYACRIDGLGKEYRIQRLGSSDNFGYRTLREDLVRLGKAPLRMLRGLNSLETFEQFWALRDVSFDVQTGDVVGVIGRNGAGKSTLLKVLSRITKPTTGSVELRGRVGSLLEVGTGFHPELTGRENIYLNGAILGMSRREINRKFDEIVAFAEVEPFLETPVKRYSSGMYVRLAFAVAAYLEPEILIVDEVLAVGDTAFQRKCMGRMSEVGRGGATVLFVSHNMPAIESLCTRGILLDRGRVITDGKVKDVVREYHRRIMDTQSINSDYLWDVEGPEREQKLIRSIVLLDDYGEPTNYLPLGGRLILRIGLHAAEPIDAPSIGIGFDDTLGQRLLTVHTPRSKLAVPRLAGRCTVDCEIAQFPLAPGDYWVKIAAGTVEHAADVMEHALRFTVVDGDAFGEGRGYQSRGVCVAPSRWGLLERDGADRR